MKQILLSLVFCTTLCTNSYGSTATYYHDYYQGKKMSNGNKFSQSQLTCASNKYRLNTYLRVYYNKKSVVCKVTDRGGFGKEHIDLSKATFKQLSPLSKGVLRVRIVKL